MSCRFIRRKLDTATHYICDLETDESAQIKPISQYAAVVYECCFPKTDLTTGAFRARKVPVAKAQQDKKQPRLITPRIVLDVPIADDLMAPLNLWKQTNQLFDSCGGAVTLVFDSGTVLIRSKTATTFSNDEFALRSIKLAENGKMAVAYCCEEPRSLLLFCESASVGFSLHDVVAFRIPFAKLLDCVSPTPTPVSHAPLPPAPHANPTMSSPPIDLSLASSTPSFAFCLDDSLLLAGSVLDGLKLYSIGDVGECKKMQLEHVWPELRVVKIVPKRNGSVAAIIDDKNRIFIIDCVRKSAPVQLGTTRNGLAAWNDSKSFTLTIMSGSNVLDVNVCTLASMKRVTIVSEPIALHWSNDGNQLVIVEKKQKTEEGEDQRGRVGEEQDQFTFVLVEYMALPGTEKLVAKSMATLDDYFSSCIDDNCVCVVSRLSQNVSYYQLSPVEKRLKDVENSPLNKHIIR